MSSRSDVIPALLEDPAAALPQWVLDLASRQQLFHPEDRVLVAVSGGPDSVALLSLLVRLRSEWRLHLGVGHLDHGLRGHASRHDAEFVADLAGQLGLPFYLGRGEVRQLARRAGLSLQMAARKLRLGFLRETCRRHDYQKLALGHTADDQVELFFWRLLRGAGADGLKGMAAASPEGLVRPLLTVAKEVILAWLAQEGIPYRQDKSNQSRAYLRNRVRLDLLPELQRLYNPRLRQAIWRTQALLREDERLLAKVVDQAWAAVGRTLGSPEVLAVNLPRLLSYDPAVQRRVLRFAAGQVGTDLTLTAAQVDSLLDLARSGRSGGLISLGGVLQVGRAGPELHFFRPLPEPVPESAIQSPDAGTVETGGWTWFLTRRPHIPGEFTAPSPDIAWFALEMVVFPLTIRPPRPGDRFWPLGGLGAKKLQDFLVDAKVPRWLRPHLPLLVSASRILWVPGLRQVQEEQPAAGGGDLWEIHLAPHNTDSQRVWKVLQACRPGPTKS